MKKSKNILSFYLFLSSLIISSIFCAPAAGEVTYTGPPITLRYSTHFPTTHMLYKNAFVPWMEALKKESKGKLIVQPYTSSSLHGARDGFKACVGDITDIAHGYPVWTAGSFALAQALALPIGFPNAMVASLTAEKVYPKYIKKEYEKMGVYMGNYQMSSGYHIFTKEPVRKLEDLKGKKIRATAGAHTYILKGLGGTPIFIVASEMYTAFQRGVVDGLFFMDGSGVSYRIHEIAKYRTQFGLVQADTPNCLNRKTFDNLPMDLKRIFYNLQRRLAIMAAIAYESNDEEGKEILRKAGVKTITLPPAELQRWMATLEPIVQNFIAENEAKGLPARQLVEEMRIHSKNYSSWTPEQFMKSATEHPIPGIIDGM